MTKERTGNNKFLKQFNQAGILDLIRVHKSISKAELSQITGLSPTATGVITSSLLELGYIHETGTGESKGGRRPVMLEMRPDSFFSVGIDLDVNYMNVILIDITGKTIYEKSMFMSGFKKVANVVNTLEDCVQKVLCEFSIGMDKLLGIGVSVPGMVDSETHEIVLAPNLGWNNVNIKPYLNIFSQAPVFIENEAMASAICENWVGSCQGVNNFVCINVKSGIGAGIFTQGRLYRGANGSAGEVGHIVVGENGPKCGCGNYGCLETVAATGRIVEKAKRLVRQGIVSSLNSFSNIEDINIDLIIAAARAGDEAARNILLEAARNIGIAISYIVNTLNPSKIVLGKEFVKYGDLVVEVIKNIVSCKALKCPASEVEIEVSGIGEKASALGAAIIPLKVLFGK